MVNVQYDGSVLLEAGIHENGQGAESAMILLLAEELGLDREPHRLPPGFDLVDPRQRHHRRLAGDDHGRRAR